jgi:uncharacterized protein (TIGR00296 family)
MIKLKDGKQTVTFARQIIDSHVSGTRVQAPELTPLFQKKLGVFVTIHTYPDYSLRGCIGIPEPIFPLKDAILDAATSATKDPRFSPLQKQELDNIIIEVTILTKPELVQVTQPSEYPSHIQIGRDGLIIEQGFYRGLLLPQVPVEQGWDVEEFLSQTCMKAGLMPDAWFDKETKISKFHGQIFSESSPRGDIQEKSLK